MVVVLAELDQCSHVQDYFSGLLTLIRPPHVKDNAVRMSLSEDADDLASFEARAGEPNLRFEDFVKDLKKRGKV